ncbi:protein-L-isoaspartate(D-aspartate) O-methyltransferase [Candidatus Sumerlaeota bacterium]|nr:protein-L-isoaspartate(D-aspartate) O-methyltransferase [Candidatus Sumerlaeota bacterium]
MAFHNNVGALKFSRISKSKEGREMRGKLGITLAIILAGLALIAACDDDSQPDEAGFVEPRQDMVKQQIVRRGVKDARVLEVMRKVERHQFVPEKYRDEAYDDHPLPIGEGQTISQPYIVAYMTEQLKLKPEDKALEIGTGSGYQAAVLAELCAEVYTIEIVEPLGEEARERLARMGYDNVHVKIGDGYKGWPEHAPFDAIIVTAAPDHVPQPLLEQLKVGGRLIIPVGSVEQELRVLTRLPDEKPDEIRTSEESVLPVRFVPMTGEAREH